MTTRPSPHERRRDGRAVHDGAPGGSRDVTTADLTGAAVRADYQHTAGEVPGAHTGLPSHRRDRRASARRGDRTRRRSTPRRPATPSSRPATAGGSRSTSRADRPSHQPTALATAGRPRCSEHSGDSPHPDPPLKEPRHDRQPSNTSSDIPLDQLAPHPRNVRRSLGDLRELTRSIRERGIETPLVVMPADGAGIHHIVAGHRRRAAAEAAGRTSAPCIVREFADEADVVLSMLAENTQRSDGLNIVDEAQALAAVIDLRGGVSAAQARRRSRPQRGMGPHSPRPADPPGLARSTPCTPGRSPSTSPPP